MEKTCPKCGNLHDNNGNFCSRSCANSRTWNKEHKENLSRVCKNSEKVKTANSSPEKRKLISAAVVLQAKNGGLNYKVLHSVEVRKQAAETKKRKRIERIAKGEFDSKKQYRSFCGFGFNLKDYPEEFDLSVVNTFGWYKASNKGNNPNGISRDHMYSIFDGFKNNISPLIISHPANCKLMRHEENFHIKNRMSSISLNDLLTRIEIWNNKYGN